MPTCKVYKTHGRTRTPAEWLYYISPLTRRPTFAALADTEWFTGAAYCCADCKKAIEESINRDPRR